MLKVVHQIQFWLFCIVHVCVLVSYDSFAAENKAASTEQASLLSFWTQKEKFNSIDRKLVESVDLSYRSPYKQASFYMDPSFSASLGRSLEFRSLPFLNVCYFPLKEDHELNVDAGLHAALSSKYFKQFSVFVSADFISLFYGMEPFSLNAQVVLFEYRGWGADLLIQDFPFSPYPSRHYEAMVRYKF